MSVCLWSVNVGDDVADTEDERRKDGKDKLLKPGKVL